MFLPWRSAQSARRPWLRRASGARRILLLTVQSGWKISSMSPGFWSFPSVAKWRTWPRELLAISDVRDQKGIFHNIDVTAIDEPGRPVFETQGATIYGEAIDFWTSKFCSPNGHAQVMQ